MNSLGQNKPVYIGSDDEIISTIEHIQIIQNIDLSIVFMGNILFYHRADHEMLESLYPNYLVTKWLMAKCESLGSLHRLGLAE